MAKSPSSLEQICDLIADPVTPELGTGVAKPAEILGAALVLLEQGIVIARRIDREALGHVVRGRSARLDHQQVLTVASVQLAGARCAAAALEQLSSASSILAHDGWREVLRQRAVTVKPDDPLSAMVFFAVGLGQALTELTPDPAIAAETLITVLAAAAANAAATADLALAVQAARATPPPPRPNRAARRRPR